MSRVRTFFAARRAKAEELRGRALCAAGRHIGQEHGGTLMFTCTRCRESFWQTEDYSHLTRLGDAMIACGDYEGAEAMVRRELAAAERPKKGAK